MCSLFLVSPKAGGPDALGGAAHVAGAVLGQLGPRALPGAGPGGRGGRVRSRLARPASRRTVGVGVQKWDSQVSPFWGKLPVMVRGASRLHGHLLGSTPFWQGRTHDTYASLTLEELGVPSAHSRPSSQRRSSSAAWTSWDRRDGNVWAECCLVLCRGA